MAEAPRTVAGLAAGLLAAEPVRAELELRVGECRIRLASNSPELVERLRHYFRFFPGDGGRPDFELVALEMPEPRLDLCFVDWKREPGKRLKEAVADLPDGRVIRKIRTGMQFLIGEGRRVAFGPCLRNANQVVNFVNFQYSAWLMQRGCVLCHAAGVAHGERGIGIAAVSGAGKSTLALHMVAHGFDYVTNDRLLVRRRDGGSWMSGVPKLARINPGTALANPMLAGILPPERRAALERLPADELWDLEEKYDVDLGELPGSPRWRLTADLGALVVLTWSRRDAGPVRLARVDLAERPDLLGVVMKDPGPFYHSADDPRAGAVPLADPQTYVEAFGDAPVWEISGGLDFDAAIQALRRIGRGESS